MTWDEAQAEYQRVYRDLAELTSRLDAIAESENTRDRYSVGGAMSRISAKAHALGRDVHLMAKLGPATAAGRIS